jgi:hypothetical protein
LQAIQAAGAARIACTNSVDHHVETIDITAVLAEGVRALLAPRPTTAEENFA